MNPAIVSAIETFLIGITLSFSDLDYKTWQFYAITGLVTVVNTWLMIV